MKKRILAFLLAVSIAVSVLVLPVSAASINNTALQTAITLGPPVRSLAPTLPAALLPKCWCPFPLTGRA